MKSISMRRPLAATALGVGLSLAIVAAVPAYSADDGDRAHIDHDTIPTAEEIQAMIPSEAEIRAMIPSEAEIRAMIPDAEEIRAMIPDIQTVEQCHASGAPVHSEESVDPATGRERIRLMICRDRLAADVRSDALEGLREARSEIAADADIPDSVRADVLASLDASIAQLSR